MFVYSFGNTMQRVGVRVGAAALTRFSLSLSRMRNIIRDYVRRVCLLSVINYAFVN